MGAYGHLGRARMNGELKDSEDDIKLTSVKVMRTSIEDPRVQLTRSKHGDTRRAVEPQQAKRTAKCRLCKEEVFAHPGQTVLGVLRAHWNHRHKQEREKVADFVGEPIDVAIEQLGIERNKSGKYLTTGAVEKSIDEWK